MYIPSTSRTKRTVQTLRIEQNNLANQKKILNKIMPLIKTAIEITQKTYLSKIRRRKRLIHISKSNKINLNLR